MYDKSKLHRGVLEGSILKIISLEEVYGYRIILILHDFGFYNINEGTIYPLLMRLEKKGYINSIFRKSPKGPKRKFYTVTKLGKENLSSFEEQWKHISNSVDKILDMEVKSDE